MFFFIKFIVLSSCTSLTILVIYLIQEFLCYEAKNNHSKSSEKHISRLLDLLGNDDNFANMFVFQPIMTAFVIIRLYFKSITNMDTL